MLTEAGNGFAAMEIDAQGRCEPVSALLDDGTERVGDLIRFLARSGELEVRCDGEIHRLSFDELQCLRFTRAIDPATSAEAFRKHGIAVETLPQRSAFGVAFTNGRVFSGELFGYGAALGGLGIYLADEAVAVRLFIPSRAIESFAVGERLGKLLLQHGEITREGLEAALERQRVVTKQRLGTLLLERRLVSREELQKAVARQAQRPVQPLGEILVEMGALTASQLEMALGLQRANRRKPIGEVLVELEMIDRDTLHRVLAEKLGIPYVDLRRFDFERNWSNLAPYPLCRDHGMVPLYLENGTLTIATNNPLDVESLNVIAFGVGTSVQPVLAAAEDIAWALEKHPERTLYESLEDGDEERVAEETDEAEVLAARLADDRLGQAEAGSALLVRLVNRVITDAFRQNVSDIHLDPGTGRERMRVRFRRDGILFDYLFVPARFRLAFVSRLKVMANLDISEHRRPQDGKIDFKRFGGLALELRIACVPTLGGVEAVVLRLLSAAKPMPLAGIGLSPEAFTQLRGMAERPHGLIIVCGPTGSGKTTTLHSVIAHLNTPERKVWTAEDPVEITQAGLTQLQVHPQIGLTFASAIRAFLRADPDVIMVGEVRDAETAGIVVEASLTGHLVLTTLHTNSAAESATRLVDIGVDPFNFADALLGVLAQRLARRLCLHCRRLAELSEAETRALADEYCLNSPFPAGLVIERWRASYANGEKLTRGVPVGCSACNKSGYSGRIALYELLVASPEIRAIIRNPGRTSEQIQRQAMLEGTRTLKQDGIEKIVQGLTTIEQVRAVSV